MFNWTVWQEPKPKISFIPFHDFSQAVKSLCTMCPFLPLGTVFDPIHSLSFLGNPTIIGISMDTRYGRIHEAFVAWSDEGGDNLFI